MKRLWLIFALIFATSARADNIDKFTWNPTLGQIQAQTHANGTKQINAAGGSNTTGTCLRSGNYILTNNDGCELLLVTTGGSTATVTLPAAVSNTGRKITVQKADSGVGTLVVNRLGSDTINGSTTFTLVSQYAWETLIASGPIWNPVSVWDVVTTTSTSATTCTSGGVGVFNTMTLSPGTYFISGSVNFGFVTTSIAAGSSTFIYGVLNSGSATFNGSVSVPSNGAPGQLRLHFDGPLASFTGNLSFSIPSYEVITTASLTIRLACQLSLGGSQNVTGNGYLQALKVN